MSGVPMDGQDPQYGHGYLRVLAKEEAGVCRSILEFDARAARRAMARLLRALQRCGNCVSSWSSPIVSALAHADTVTARHLTQGRGSMGEVRSAITMLRTTETLILECLTPSMRSAVRTVKMRTRIDDDELLQPLVRPKHAAGVLAEARAKRANGESLRAGLTELDIDALGRLGRRMGVLEADESLLCPRTRAEVVETVAETLCERHLLSILVATLSAPARRLLADLVHGLHEGSELRVMAERDCQPSDPLHSLRACGLVFCSNSAGDRTMWIPVELRTPLRGIVAEFGL